MALSVEAMHGIGEKTAEKLNEIHIHTIEQLAKGDEHIIRAKIGKHGIDLQKRAKGTDDRKWIRVKWANIKVSVTR